MRRRGGIPGGIKEGGKKEGGLKVEGGKERRKGGENKVGLKS